MAGNLRDIWTKSKPGLGRLLKDGLGQARVRGRGLASWAHIWLFAGFMVLLVGTVLLEVDHLASRLSPALKFHQGSYYVIYEFTLDVFGLLLLAGSLFFLWRRTRRPDSIGHRMTDWYVIFSLLAIGITGYLVEGLRICWQQPAGIGAWCSPVGLLVSRCFAGLPEAAARKAHLAVWWIHALLAFGFMASMPYTRLMHSIAGTLNIFLVRPQLGQMAPITPEEVEQSERIGVEKVTDFSQQQLLSLDACMECGRCEEACPAFATGKPLSPKKLVQDLNALMGFTLSHGATPRLHDQTIQAETLWACTTCSACTQVCPVRVDPLTMLTDMRRNLVGENKLSGPTATALRRMQSSGNPWGLPADERTNWAENLGVPTVKENPEFDVLYWIGCAGTYDRRARRVAGAFAKILKHAGVNFAILGREEKCTGESARRLGDEFLFQELARANVATLARHHVRKIVTHCPHCLNSLLKDYPQFGGHYEVVHHTQFLKQLLTAGRLTMPDSERSEGAITYHDPCYLARANGIHKQPRDVLKAAFGLATELREMPRNREKTSCCGAGGGRMWMEEDPKQRVCSVRAKEALDTGAGIVVVSCPFCLTMMTDGAALQTRSMEIADVAEVIAKRLWL